MKRLVKSIVSVALLIAGVPTLAGCGASLNVPAPTSYTSYADKDGVFRCDCPVGWTVTPRGKQFQGTTFSSGNAEIRIEVDAIAPGASDAAPVAKITDQDLPTVTQLHDAAKKGFTRYLTDYEERPAMIVKTALGDVCKSEFDYPSRITGKMHGYRVTTVTGGKRLQMGCTCPERDWTALQPAFDHVIVSLRPGAAE